MENASKALLISAAVLIVIALIAFAMQVFNSTKDVTEDVTPTADWMTLHTVANSIDIQFNKYSGNQRGTVIHKMLEEVAEYNKKDLSYKPGDSTTTSIRKIAVMLSGKIFEAQKKEAEKVAIFGTNANPNTTQWDTIGQRFKEFIIENEYYNVTTEISIVPGGNYIYMIKIGF